MALSHEWTTPEETARFFQKAAPGTAFCKRCGRFNTTMRECRAVSVELRNLPAPHDLISQPSPPPQA